MGHAPPVHRIADDITAPLTLRRGCLYLVTTQVHVLAGVTVTAEDGASIGIINGRVPGGSLQRAALIFDAGSSLQARRLSIRATNRRGVPQKHPDNGGVWFFGAHHRADKDGMQIRKTRATPLSFFRAKRLSAYYLGRGDAPEGSAKARHDNAHGLDDLDGVSVMGVGFCEWNIAEVYSRGSGDDGFDLQNSAIMLRRLLIDNPTEDALNISSSRLDIVDELRVTMTRRGERSGEDADRDIFDLEVDDSPSQVVLHRGSRVKLHGVFGDEVRLASKDMPQPRTEGRSLYRFQGRCDQDLAIVYSISED